MGCVLNAAHFYARIYRASCAMEPGEDLTTTISLQLRAISPAGDNHYVAVGIATLNTPAIDR